MPEHEDQLLRRTGLVFFGGILAGQTHELTNVHNVINELTGLQEDVLAAAEGARIPDVEKLRRITEKIRSQLERAETIVRSMNRFAHSVDGPVLVFDVKEALERITYLAQRAANLGKTALDQDFPTRSASLETNLFGFNQAVFTCVETALAASREHRRISVGYRVLETGVEITVMSADPIPAVPGVIGKRSHLGPLVRELGGRVAAEPGADDPHRFTLFFPRTAPAPERRTGAAKDE